MENLITTTTTTTSVAIGDPFPGPKILITKLSGKI